MWKKCQCRKLLVGSLAVIMLVAGSSFLEAKPRRRPASGKASAIEAAKYRGPRRSIAVLPSQQVIWAVPALEQLSMAVFESSPYFTALPAASGNRAVDAETLAGSVHFTKATTPRDEVIVRSHFKKSVWSEPSPSAPSAVANSRSGNLATATTKSGSARIVGLQKRVAPTSQRGSRSIAKAESAPSAAPAMEDSAVMADVQESSPPKTEPYEMAMTVKM